MPGAWYLKIVKEIVTSTLTPFVFVLGGVGVVVTRTCPERQSNGSIPRSRDAARMFHWWLAAMILFIVIVGYGIGTSGINYRSSRFSPCSRGHVRFCRLENLQPGREKVSFDFVGCALQLFRICLCARFIDRARLRCATSD